LQELKTDPPVATPGNRSHICALRSVSGVFCSPGLPCHMRVSRSHRVSAAVGQLSLSGTVLLAPLT